MNLFSTEVAALRDNINSAINFFLPMTKSTGQFSRELFSPIEVTAICDNSAMSFFAQAICDNSAMSFIINKAKKGELRAPSRIYPVGVHNLCRRAAPWTYKRVGRFLTSFFKQVQTQFSTSSSLFNLLL